MELVKKTFKIMKIEKFINNLKRVLSSNGIITITNSRQIKVDISDEMFTFLNYVELKSNDFQKLKVENENLEMKIKKLEKYKKAVEEIVERKRILDSDPSFIVKRKIKQLAMKDHISSEDISSKDYELIEIFEILEKYKIQ